MPRMERARRPPKAENRAHIPRAIASREAMLWQGCSLSPSELERKAPRSVWATQLPASRPIRWIVRESREANRTDFARIPSDGLRDAAARPRTDSPAFYRTNFARAPARQSDGLTFGIPSPAFPRTDFARIRKADADSTISQPRYGRNQPPLNHEPTILRVEYKNDTISTKPSYFSDSPTPTDTQKQFNLNQKTGARSSVQSPLQAK